MKGTVSLAHTYAAALEQPGARLFWALTALHNYTVLGADTTNAFAEAPPLVAPLYVTIDKSYRGWWENVKKRPPIPKGHVLPVHHALRAIQKVPAYGQIDGHKVFSLQQVDNFAVSAPTKDITDKVFAVIQRKLKELLKMLGEHNGAQRAQCYTGPLFSEN